MVFNTTFNNISVIYWLHCRAWYGSFGLIPRMIWKMSCNNLLISLLSNVTSKWCHVTTSLINILSLKCLVPRNGFLVTAQAVILLWEIQQWYIFNTIYLSFSCIVIFNTIYLSFTCIVIFNTIYLKFHLYCNI